MKKINYLFVTIILLSIVFGQPRFEHPPAHFYNAIGLINLPSPQMNNGGRRDERMEMMMAWKLTNDLDLTTEQAEKFFPRFNTHRKNMESIEDKIFKISSNLKEDIDKGKDIKEKDFNKTMESISSLEIQKLNERERFINEMSDILSINQLAKLSLFKHYFINDLRKEILKRPRDGAK